MTKKEEYLAKRLKLSQLSQQAKELKENFINQSETTAEALYWAGKSLNYFLLYNIYETNGATEFNTFNQWKEKGATILKGSKAFLIWGQPVKNKKEEEQKEKTEDPYKYFPVCYLFSNLQVATAEDKAIKKEEAPERVKQAEPQIKEEFVI